MQLQYRKPFLTIFFEKRAPDFPASCIKQLNVKQHAFTLRIGPSPNLRFVSDASFDRPSETYIKKLAFES